MSNYLTNKVEVLVENGQIFASEVKTKEIKLNNFQSAKIVISTGEGETATTKAKLVAILPDSTEQDIKEQEIIIGGNTQTEINVVANEIAHYDATSIKIVIEAIADSTITGNVVALLGEPRYAVEIESVDNSVANEDSTQETPETETIVDGGDLSDDTEESGTETDPTDENGEQVVE